MTTQIDAAEDVDTREVTEWMSRRLDWVVAGEAGSPGKNMLNGNPGDERHVIGVYALEVHGDTVGYFEVHTSDGSIFTAHISRKD